MIIGAKTKVMKFSSEYGLSSDESDFVEDTLMGLSDCDEEGLLRMTMHNGRRMHFQIQTSDVRRLLTAWQNLVWARLWEGCKPQEYIQEFINCA